MSFVPQSMAPFRASSVFPGTLELIIGILVFDVADKDAVFLVPTLEITTRYTEKGCGRLVIMRNRQDILLCDVSGSFVTRPVSTWSVNGRSAMGRGLTAHDKRTDPARGASDQHPCVESNLRAVRS